MAFKRSAVRSRLSPPKASEILEFQKLFFLSKCSELLPPLRGVQLQKEILGSGLKIIELLKLQYMTETRQFSF